eukprot:gene6065-8350_t
MIEPGVNLLSSSPSHISNDSENVQSKTINENSYVDSFLKSESSDLPLILISDDASSVAQSLSVISDNVTILNNCNGLSYDGIDFEEYLDLSAKNLGLEGVLKAIKNHSIEAYGNNFIPSKSYSRDEMKMIERIDHAVNSNVEHHIKHINLSYNITADDILIPRNMVDFFKLLNRYLKRCPNVIALDLAGNHLFDHRPHPSNEHKKDYVVELTNCLLTTRIQCIDISENNIIGKANREYKGLSYFISKFFRQSQFQIKVSSSCQIGGTGIRCRFNNLNSQAFQIVSQGLGIGSTLTYLDISDNMGGIDPLGDYNPEGITSIANALVHSIPLQTLKIARNFLRDDFIMLIGNAVCNMVNLQVLDLSGNNCLSFGCESLKLALLSHSGLIVGNGQGLRELDISNNSFGYDGIINLVDGLAETHTLQLLRMSNCNLNDSSITLLETALMNNTSIYRIDISRNPIRRSFANRVLAQIKANNLIHNIRKNHMSVDANSLTKYEYEALAKKLKFLRKHHLQDLYNNPSFTVVGSVMFDSLQILQPPPRQAMINQIVEKNNTLQARLEKSAMIEKRITASQVIHKNVMVWYEVIRKKRSLFLILMEAQRKREEEDQRNTDDDMFLNY